MLPCCAAALCDQCAKKKIFELNGKCHMCKDTVDPENLIPYRLLRDKVRAVLNSNTIWNETRWINSSPSLATSVGRWLHLPPANLPYRDLHEEPHHPPLLHLLLLLTTRGLHPVCLVIRHQEHQRCALLQVILKPILNHPTPIGTATRSCTMMTDSGSSTQGLWDGKRNTGVIAGPTFLPQTTLLPPFRWY